MITKNKNGDEPEFNRREICFKCSKFKDCERWENICKDCFLNREVEDDDMYPYDSFGSAKIDKKG